MSQSDYTMFIRVGWYGVYFERVLPFNTEADRDGAKNAVSVLIGLDLDVHAIVRKNGVAINA